MKYRFKRYSLTDVAIVEVALTNVDSLHQLVWYTNEIRNNISFALDNIGETLESINGQAAVALITYFIDLIIPIAENANYEFNFTIEQESKRVDIYRLKLYLPVLTVYKSEVFGTAYCNKNSNQQYIYKKYSEQTPYVTYYMNNNYDENYKLGQQAADIIKKNNEFYNYSSALSQIQGDKNVNWKSIKYFSVVTTF